MAAAQRLGHYYLAHALAAFDHMGADPVVDDARHLLDWIARARQATFTRRHLFTAIKNAWFRKVTDLDPALDLLEQHGHIRAPVPEPGPRGGRPASPPYLAHPDLHSALPTASAVTTVRVDAGR